MEEQLTSVLQIVQSLGNSHSQQDTGAVIASQTPVFQADHLLGVHEPVSERDAQTFNFH